MQGCSNLYENALSISTHSNTFNLTNVEQQVDDQTFTASTLEFEGIDTLWQYNAEIDCEIDITYLLSVSSGKAKLVLISPDGTVTTVVEHTADSQQETTVTSTLSIKSGENRIKLVAADKAQVELSLSMDVGEFLKLGMS